MDIDDYDKDVLRRTVHEFYDQGEFPTSAKVLSKYQEKTGYKGSKTSMWRILKSLKFSYKKCIDFLWSTMTLLICVYNF